MKYRSRSHQTWMYAILTVLPLVVAAAKGDVVLIVNTTADGNDGACNVESCTLREAVIASTGYLDDDVEILLGEGVYTLSLGGNDDGALSGDLDINFGQVTISGIGPEQTIIDANFINRVFHVAPISTATLILRDLTVRNGRAWGFSGPGTSGSVGSGIAVSSSGSLTLENVVVTNCSASDFAGGILVSGPTTIKDSALIGNSVTAPFGNGGAMWIDLGQAATLERTLIKNNSAPNGGAVAHLRGTLHLIDCMVESNSGSIDPILLNPPFNPTLTATRTTFKGNSGVLTTNGAGTNVTMENCTLSGNTLIAAIRAGNGGGTVTLTNCTVAGNSAGGLQRFGGTINLHNTIVAGNGSFDASGTFNSLGYNLIGNAAGLGLSGVTTGNLLNVNPMLGPLQDNGGYTHTHALLKGSPAVDAADPLSFPLLDQRGAARPIDGNSDSFALPDIGAFESDADTPESPGDLDDDGSVGVSDILILLSEWGSCGDCNNCPADVDGNCAVSVQDLLLLLANWG